MTFKPSYWQIKILKKIERKDQILDGKKYVHQKEQKSDFQFSFISFFLSWLGMIHRFIGLILMILQWWWKTRELTWKTRSNQILLKYYSVTAFCIPVKKGIMIEKDPAWNLNLNGTTYLFTSYWISVLFLDGINEFLIPKLISTSFTDAALN